MAAIKITATDIRTAMVKQFNSQEYAIMWEVANATGTNVRRYADAVIMSLWPSRGLELHGVEIKVNRHDWLKEAQDPTKAEEIAKFCDRWWVHTSPNIVRDVSELPPMWGLREYDGKQWKTIKQAERTEAQSITRGFLASLLRRADGPMRAAIEEARNEAYKRVQEQMDEQRKRYQDDVEKAVIRKLGDVEEDIKKIKDFEAAFGEGAAKNWGINHKRLGRAAFALHQCDLNGYGRLSTKLREAADALDAINNMMETE